MRSTLTWLGFGILVGLVAHLAGIFALPRIAPADAPNRITAVSALNSVTVLPDTNAVMPTADPAFVTAVCRYDLSQNPLRVRTGITNHYTSISYYDATGLAYGAINDRSAARRLIDFYVVTAEQRRHLINADEELIADTLIIQAPGPKGFIVIRGLAVQPGEVQPVREALMREARCGLVPVESIGER